MDAVVLAVGMAAVVDAASGDDGHIRVFSDEKVVVDHFLETGLIHDHGNIDGFIFCAGENMDIDSIPGFSGFNINMAGGVRATLFPLARML